MFKIHAPKTIVVAIAAAAVAAPAYAGSGISNVRYYGPHAKPEQKTVSYEQVVAKAEAVHRTNSMSDVFTRAVARGKSKINRGVRPDDRAGTHGIGCPNMSSAA